MFHILIIGSAGNFDSKGQLPLVSSIKTFIESNHNKCCYFYFIDPNHFECDNDMKLMTTYYNAKINFSFINRNFSFDTFQKEYLINNNDEALFIDCANIVSSEYEFVNRLGNNTKWYYYCYGCNSPQINLMDIYNKAKVIPHYTIYSETKVPRNISKNYRVDILNDLQPYLSVIKYLTLDKENIPQWIKTRFGNEQNYDILLENSYNIVINLFEHNDIIDYNSIDVSKWSDIARKIILLK